MAGWYELREYPDGFEFQLRASSGGLLLTGVRRPSSEMALEFLHEVQEWVADPLHIERRSNTGGEPYFVVIGSHREELAQSPPCMTAISREYAIESARLYGVTDDIRVIRPSAVDAPA